MEVESREIVKPKFTLRPENILPQDRLPVPELLSEEMASLGWPLELQGTGKTDYQNRELKILYPLGDVFFSLATTIHELGHWRQSEIDVTLKKREQFIPDEDLEDIVANEESAYRRGLERVKKYAPELLAHLNTKFQEYKKRGKLEHFKNFEELYQWFMNFGLTISQIIQDADENKIYEALKNAGMEERFREFALLRVGEIVKRDEMEPFLIKVGAGVANE